MPGASDTVDELAKLWNANADEHNQWDSLGLDEIVAFAQQQEREACAKICDVPAGAEAWEYIGGKEGFEIRRALAVEIRERSNT